MRKPVFITTPIYYPNAAPHIGTAYTTFAADILRRWCRLRGRRSFFLTGVDEHGQKIERAATALGFSPRALVDRQAEVFKATFQALHIEYDRFIRTTDRDHVEVVSDVLTKVFESGDIYKGLYVGHYCVECEAYYSERELDDQKCPIHGVPAKMLSEECYYFRLSNYRDWLLKFYEETPSFIRPLERRTEVLNLVTAGLDDLNISRSSFTWGIPLPFDPTHVTYVWFDALLNYLSGINFLECPETFNILWEGSLHLIGKDILRFHAIIWPAMLRCIGVPPPKQIFAHGFWTIGGQKFGKSTSNAVSPIDLVARFGVDPLRYYMFRAFQFGTDGDFVVSDLVVRNNSELSQGLGNLVQRTTKMVDQYCSGRIPLSARHGKIEEELVASFAAAEMDIEAAMENLELHDALKHIWRLISVSNVYANTRAPWHLHKSGHHELVCTTLAHLVECVRCIAVQVSPFIPSSSQEILRRLGSPLSGVPTLAYEVDSLGGKQIEHGPPIFPLLVLDVGE